MFDTMNLIKAAGALIGSLLLLMLVSWGADALYHVDPSGEHAEAEGEIQQAYAVPVEEAAAPAEGAAAPEAVDIAALMASADVGAGEKVFGKCKSCHKIDGGNATGPHLNGVVGRAVASLGDYAYSDAMKAHAGEAPDWTPEALQAFLTNPKGVVPGTKMNFAGLPKPQDRANLIAWLETTKG